MEEETSDEPVSSPSQTSMNPEEDMEVDETSYNWEDGHLTDIQSNSTLDNDDIATNDEALQIGGAITATAFNNTCIIQEFFIDTQHQPTSIGVREYLLLMKEEVRQALPLQQKFYLLISVEMMKEEKVAEVAF